MLFRIITLGSLFFVCIVMLAIVVVIGERKIFTAVVLGIKSLKKTTAQNDSSAFKVVVDLFIFAPVHQHVTWVKCPVKLSVGVTSPRRTAEGREAVTSRRLWRWHWRRFWAPAVANMGVLGGGRGEPSTPPLSRTDCWVAFQHDICSHGERKSIRSQLSLPLPCSQPLSVPTLSTQHAGCS